jgi:putative ABC transport system permease protein
MATVGEGLADARRRGRWAMVRSALAEWANVVVAGLGMRVEDARLRVRKAGTTRRRMTMGWMDDVRIAARGLRRAPGFTAIVVGTLALGIGADAAVWNLVDRVLLRPLPYDHPGELVLVWGTRSRSDERVPLRAPDAAVVGERARAFASVAFLGRATDATMAADRNGSPGHVVAAGVTPGFFETLGVPTALGRGFLEEDAVAAADESAPPGVLISDAAWRRVFGADMALPGRAVLLDGRPVVVLGVVPPGFRLELPPAAGIDTDIDVWIPFRVPLSEIARRDGRRIDQDSDNGGAVIARLAAGVSVEAADAELRRVAAELGAEIPDYAAAGFGLEARSLHADATAHVRPLLVLLGGGAAGVLLVACLGLLALLLARGMAREGELAVRAALGAGRWRIAGSLLAESLLLLAAGCGAAVGVALGVGGLLEGLLPPAIASLAAPDAGLPWPPILTASGTVALLFTTLALVQARLAGRNGCHASPLLRSRFGRTGGRRTLVVAEIAVSVVLVLGAGLLVRTADNLRRVQPGFRPTGALAFDVAIRVAGSYSGPAERARLARTLEQAVLSVRGVEDVGLTGALPLSGRRWTQPWGLPGEAEGGWAAHRADFRMVTSGYFRAIGTRIVEGRAFTRDEDLEERRRVAIVDETLASRIAPRGSAIGAAIGIPLDGRAVQARVVGVVEPVRQDDLGRPGRGTIYVPYRQEASRDVAFVVRTDGDPAALAASVRRAILAVEPRLAVYGMRPMTDYVDAALAPTRFGLVLLTAYALLALLAAALGLYGVVAWDVGRRTRDLGVRMAIGATAAQVRRGVLLEGLGLGAAGGFAGAVAAAILASALRRLVYGVGVADPATWAGVAAVIGAVTLLATWIPARRASLLDPTQALRSD